MANLTDSYILQKSSNITVVGTEQQDASLALTSTSNVSSNISGYIYDTTIGTGTVIADAILTVYDDTAAIVATTQTDVNGYYLIELATEGDYQIFASKTGYIISPLHDFTIVADVPIFYDIALIPDTSTPTNNIYGIVTDGDDAAIENASVVVMSSGAIVAETLSIADGEYAINDLDDGTYTVIISKSGYDSYSHSVTVEDGESGKLDAQLTADPIVTTASISGVITDVTTTAAIPGAFVGLYSITGGVPETLVATTVTNATGVYIFTGVTAGSYVVKSKAVEEV